MIDQSKIIFEGKKRYYIEDLTQRDYSLENSTPYKMVILSHEIKAGAWVEMIRALASFLVSTFIYDREQLLACKCGWSKALMFTAEERTNHKKVEEGLYVNCNHTALHSCWFIQDLLDLFNVDKAEVTLLIHRPSGAESKEIKEFLSNKVKSDFEEFLVKSQGKDKESAKKIVSNIEKYINPLLRKISKSHVDFFLFDDVSVMSNYVRKVKEMVEKRLDLDEKIKKALNKYLGYIVAFYKE